MLANILIELLRKCSNKNLVLQRVFYELLKIDFNWITIELFRYAENLTLFPEKLEEKKLALQWMKTIAGSQFFDGFRWFASDKKILGVNVWYMWNFEGDRESLISIIVVLLVTSLFCFRKDFSKVLLYNESRILQFKSLETAHVGWITK